MRVRVQGSELFRYRAQGCLWGDGGAAAFRGLSMWGMINLLGMINLRLGGRAAAFVAGWFLGSQDPSRG